MAVVTLPDMQVGYKSPVVLELRRLLVKIQAMHPDTVALEGDVYGPMTERAVRLSQAMMGLPQTGKVDANTWAALYTRAGEAKAGGVASGDPYTREGRTLLAAAAAAQAQAQAQQGPVVVSGGQVVSGPGSGMVLKLAFGAAVLGVAWWAYRRMQKTRTGPYALVDGLDHDAAGPTIRPSKSHLAGSSRRKKSARRPADPQPAEGEDTATGPTRRHGRSAFVTERRMVPWTAARRETDSEEEAEDVIIDPGPAPKVMRLEADPKLWKDRPQYREDMKRMAWERAQASDREIHIVKRGSSKVLYRAGDR